MASNSNQASGGGGRKSGARGTGAAKVTQSISKTKRNVRIVLGSLLAANVVAAALVLYPPGGSTEGLGQQLSSLQTQVMQNRTRLEETREHTAAVQAGRAEGDEFLDEYFIRTRVVNSTLVAELNSMANRSGITPRGDAYTAELIEGSEQLGVMSLTVNFEASYRQLMNFIREIDRSPSLMIMSSLTAAPQQDNGQLLVTLQMNAFTQEDGTFAPLTDPDENAMVNVQAEVAP